MSSTIKNTILTTLQDTIAERERVTQKLLDALRVWESEIIEGLQPNFEVIKIDCSRESSQIFRTFTIRRQRDWFLYLDDSGYLPKVVSSLYDTYDACLGYSDILLLAKNLKRITELLLKNNTDRITEVKEALTSLKEFTQE